MKTYPTPTMLHMDFALLSMVGEPRVWDYTAYALSQLPTLNANNISAYTFIFSVIPNPVPGSSLPFISGFFGELILQDSFDEAGMTALVAPIVAHINETWPGALAAVLQTFTRYNSFLEWYDAHYDKGTASGDAYIASRLLDVPALTGNLTALSNAIKTITTFSGAMSALMVSGKGVHDAKPRGGSNAVLPAWRKAIVHASKCPFFLLLYCLSWFHRILTRACPQFLALGSRPLIRRPKHMQSQG
jgi:hypothetical protein